MENEERKMAKERYQVIVIGGGASGMAAAIAALEEGMAGKAAPEVRMPKEAVSEVGVPEKAACGEGGRQKPGKKQAGVLLLESNDRVGKKILATGNGKCNFTNKNVSPAHYNTDDRAVLEAVLAGFPTEEALRFFEKLGMLSREKNGYFYPMPETASTVLDVLRLRLSELGCDILCGIYVEKIEKSKEGFQISFREQGQLHREQCGSVILSTGSKAGGFLQNKQEDPLRLAKSLGLHSTALYPALTKCICREGYYYRQLAGVRAQAKLSLYAENNSGKKTGGKIKNGWELLKRESGELQLTKEGISGIAVFQLSGMIAQKLAENRRVNVEVNFLPDFREDALEDWAEKRLSLLPGRTLEEFFLGILHKKVLGVCLQAEGFLGTMKIPAVGDNARSGRKTEDCPAERRAVMMILSVMKRAMHFTTEVTAVSDMKQAQVCRGGLSLSQFNERLECKKIPGLFACGEVLNVDGECGGYNLHFAWASGVLAGKEAMRRRNTRSQSSFWQEKGDAEI